MGEQIERLIEASGLQWTFLCVRMDTPERNMF
jgi:hypothetical protein